ncbi:MAG: nickel-binding protein [Acidimicrobiales bacterium]
MGHVTPEQVAKAGSASKRAAAEQFPDTIVWRHSLVVESDEGAMTYCLYESTDEATIRAHAAAAGMPCDRITAVKMIGPDDF